VVDLGSGAFANLVRHRAPEALDALVITHMHADHFLDIIPLRYALKYGERTSARKLPLYLPPGGESMLRRLCSAFAKEGGADFLAEVFIVRTFDPAASLRLGTVTLTFAPAQHYIETYALRCDAAGASLTYSSDTAPTQSVVALARESNLLLCEATLTDAETAETADDAEPERGHMSAREAGRTAAQAPVERLLLTHYSATAVASELIASARLSFTGPVDVVDDGYYVEL
jgi:ribonuclease BN (tRNA processing enzyme)